MAQEHRIRETLETFLARVRADVDAHTTDLATDVLRLADEREAQWREDTDKAVEAARAEIERTYRARLETMRSDMAREYETRLASERAGVRDSSDVTQHAHRLCAESLEWLQAATRRIDDAPSLTGILDALARAAAETSRVAILLVDGDTLRNWGHFGFAAGEGPGDVPLRDAGVLAAAVALKQTTFVPPVVSNTAPAGPAFMRVPAGQTGLVVPIVVGGDVVGVLYADDVGRRDELQAAQVGAEAEHGAPIWTEQVGLLVRYAALRLENVATVRTAEVLST